VPAWACSFPIPEALASLRHLQKQQVEQKIQLTSSSSSADIIQMTPQVGFASPETKDDFP
jgi:hypothetical protein